VPSSLVATLLLWIVDFNKGRNCGKRTIKVVQRKVRPGDQLLLKPTHTNRNKFYVFLYVFLGCDLMK